MTGRKAVAATVLILAGILVLLYPVITNRTYQKQVEQSYEEFVDTSHPVSENHREIQDPVLETLYEDLMEKNRELYEQGQPELTDPWSYEQTEVDLSEYGLQDNIIGYLSIPVMEIRLPVYLGADRKQLKKGAAHMTNTSYPVGGENTNCVIAAHRGYYKAEMFRQIERLQIKDPVILENFRETLTYEVTEIQVVDPDEVEPLLIQPGKELLTLLTCHPLGGDAQRYIVICERTEKKSIG